MADWQPISTAPKDGTPILVPSPMGAIWMAHWKTMIRVPDRWETYGLGAIPFEPTHWQPLPAPPETPTC